MCGIIAIVRRPGEQRRVDAATWCEEVDTLVGLINGRWADPRRDLDLFADRAAALDESLKGLAGLLTMLSGSVPLERMQFGAESLGRAVAGAESRLAEVIAGRSAELDVEALNASYGRLRDGAWAIERDRFRAAGGVVELGGTDQSVGSLAAFLSLHQALSSLDRLEVRGRDSAGIEVVVRDHALDVSEPSVRAQLSARSGGLFTSGEVRSSGDEVVFVYKAAAEIGELGDNTAELRRQISGDELLRAAVANDSAAALVLGHTRWASIGIISEPNAHPQVSDEASFPGAPLVTAVLNGDVDNFADLIAADDLEVPASVTTDAKVIPVLISRRLARGEDTSGAFRASVDALEGSVAIAASVADGTGRLLLALRGSGQALYVGLAEGAFIVASEPYGVIEETATYLRLDGETPANVDSPSTSRGQIVELIPAAAGSPDGIHRRSYDGIELAVSPDELVVAEITTRDIDRGAFPHYLLKEISDAPESFRRTLRGKLLGDGTNRNVLLGPATLPDALREGLRSGRISRVLVIGQGTAAVAGQSLAVLLADLVGTNGVMVEALPATELSGFRLRRDMSDTLVVAISQSGTTTDTNRTVDLVRGRGASVVAIVNRRGSDLTDKADGVLYTSDGRDVEMSVASTKAFYSQIAAGILLAVAIAADIEGTTPVESPEMQSLLGALVELPDRLTETLARRSEIGEVARQFAPPRRYWAIVGNGLNQIAARELRIKLSELCYKAIACDATEDKKHIDLSSEPLILVCAAGLVGSTADDVAKEVAIFKAHKATPIVIATDGTRFSAATAVLRVPPTHPSLAFVLSAMVGHLFGYEAALAIDAQAIPLREARGAIEEIARDHGGGDDLMPRIRERLGTPLGRFFDGLRSGAYNGHLEASTAVRLSGVARYALGLSGLDSYQAEFGKVGTPGVVVDDLTTVLTAAIEELTRPIDAIKHQAKTVTVGISRSDESLLNVPLVAATLAAGAPRDRLAYSTLRAIADLDAAVEEVTGFTRYAIDGEELESATVVVTDKGGLAAGLVSRTDRDPRLRGTKHLVAREQELMVTRGRSDGRTVLIIPETKDGGTDGLTLLHIRLREHLGATTARAVMQGYRRRYHALQDAVTETEDSFRDDLLAEQSVLDLLCEPINDLAERWREA